MPLIGSAHGRVWWASLGADSLVADVPRAKYEELVAAADGLELPEGSPKADELGVIEKDLRRTFPEDPAFGAVEAPLRRVLRAYCVRQTYCQGMSFIAGTLLQHMDEYASFCALAALIETLLPPAYFSHTMAGAYMDQHIAFSVFLRHRLPRLAAHLSALDFPLSLVGVRWFLCLFAADLSAKKNRPVKLSELRA